LQNDKNTSSATRPETEVYYQRTMVLVENESLVRNNLRLLSK